MTFEECVNLVIDEFESEKLTNDPRDPGGITKFGIAKKYHPDVDVANLTRAQAIDIYRREYWQPCRCDELPPLLRLAVFDAAVNPGPQLSIEFLQHALGVIQDGIIGPKTIAASQSATPVHLARMLTGRIMYYSDSPNFHMDGGGWVSRCIRVAMYSVWQSSLT